MDLAALHPPLASTSTLPPSTVCDVLLDAAISSDVDMIWLEPRLTTAEDRYDVSMERRGRVIATTSLDGSLGAAVVARLAMIAEIDLVGRRIATGRAEVRSPTASAEIVVTTRPGRALRGEVLVRRHQPRGVSSPMDPVALTPGTVVGQYRIVERLGAGGMGEVFRVTHSALGRGFALKVLSVGVMTSDAEAVTAFLREARAAARIKHPHIIDVFDFGHLSDGRPYLVMELIDGRSLAAMIADDPLEVRTALTIARQLASALAAAHEVGVIHADVSPSNVLVHGEIAKLVDFGLAQLRDDPARVGAEPAKFVFGTPSYIAPELIRGLGAVEASDQYSLGAVLYEMLTGHPPFAAKTVREVCMLHLRAPVPPLELPDGLVPTELRKVVDRCLAKRAEQRFPTMTAVEAALAEVEQVMFARGWRRWLAP